MTVEAELLAFRLRLARKQGRKRLRLTRPTRPVPTTGIERRYTKAILEGPLAELRDAIKTIALPGIKLVVAAAPAAVNRHNSSEHADGYDDILEAVIGRVTIRVGERATDSEIRRIARAALDETQEHNDQQLRRQVNQVLGVDPLRNEPWLEDLLADAATANAKLIKGLTAQQVERLQQTIRARVRAGDRAEDIAAEVRERFVDDDGDDAAKAERRAALIARDQVGKLNASLDRVRQTEIGIKSYVWRTSRDERVRPEHAERDGVTFSWDEPPNDGHPGEPINCRCYPEPVFEDILEAL